MKKSFITFGLLLLMILALQLNAQIPRTLSYQGILTDNAGNPRPEKNYQFTFSLYDTSTGGAPMWSEQKTLAVNKGGLFSTILGDRKPFGAAVKFDKQYWLGIRVDNEVELLPRIPLTSVGYSLNAVRADTAKVAQVAVQGSGWTKTDSSIYYLGGKLGIGTTNPQGLFDINGGISPTDALYVKGNPYIEDQGGIIHHQGGTYAWQEIAQWTDYEYGVLKFNYVNRKAPNIKVKKSVFSLSGNGTVRVPILQILGGSDLAEPCVQVFGKSSKWGHPEFVIENNDQGYDQVALGIRSGSVYDWEFAGMHDGRLVIQDQLSKSPNLIINPGPSGAVTVPVLQITGGSDLAEPFRISHTDSLPVGSLVVIDPEQPGKLKQATEPYDKRVAGVISGAGGINPGLTLTQEGKLTGSQHVALTGKVYALATAANGAIEPGDLLTTSHVPGHAMKATDHERAFGTVIGKAMSSLKSGEGLILVLVNLQ